MKRIIFILFSLILTFSIYAQASDLPEEEPAPVTEEAPVPEEEHEVEPETDEESPDEIAPEDEGSASEETSDDDTTGKDKSDSIKASKGGISKIPSSKRPKAIDKEKAEKAAEKDEGKNAVEDKANTIKYGIPSEISTLIDDLIKNDDPRFTEEIYDVFQITQNNTIKEKILKYFTKLEDPCIEDYAVEILNDPYDVKGDLVKACFQYISAVKTKEAIPAVLSLIESENDSYFNDAIATIGEIGGPSEAMFLVEYLERDDLSDAQRQTLMRNCGKMHAVQTWSKVVEVAEDEDENLYVRMYAAEALGLMEKKESVPVLTELFTENDPNLRQYVIKGLSHFPDVVEAKETVMQGVRDEHWRVRQEAIRTAKENKLTDAMPYLIYRAKNDSEKVIKDEAYAAVAALDTKEGNDFLVGQLEDKKVGDATKKKVVEVLLKEGHAGEKEILALAEECLNDDKRKDLRHAIGKELAKYENSAYKKICLAYLGSKDSTTISLGLDMYKTNKFSEAETVMRDMYAEKKTNSSVKSRIKKMLNIEDEDK